MNTFGLIFFLGSPRRSLVPLLGGEGGEHVGLARVELLHLLLDEGVVVLPGRLQVLPLLHQLGVGQHLPVLGHLLDDGLVVALDGAVVLVDLDAQLATGGEVLRLG